MVVSASDLGPGRLRLAADAAKREALMLASEWGTPLAPIPGYLAEVFRSPFGEHAQQLINGWEEDMNDLGNHLFRLSGACEAAADEEEAIAHIVANGLAAPSRFLNLTEEFGRWEARPRKRRLVDASYPAPDELVMIDPVGICHAAAKLENASDEFDAARGRLKDTFLDVKLAVPEELGWLVEDSANLATELRTRAHAYERADSSVRDVFPGWSTGLLGPSLDTLRGGPAPADPALRARQDVKRFLREVRPTGPFDQVDMAKARAIIGRAERVAAHDPAYAVAFLEALGPRNLRWLIEQGETDPCVINDIVARASTGGTGVEFLRKTLGTGKEAPRRAAMFARCPCPGAQLDPGWVEQITVTLLKGRDTSSLGDPRRWYRQAAADLLRANPAGAIAFINANPKLACSALFSYNDAGGTVAQAGLHDMLGSPPPGLEKEADDALERIIPCANEHEFTPEGQRALGKLFARPRTYEQVTRLLLRPTDAQDPQEAGFVPDFSQLQTVLARVMGDTEAHGILVERAKEFAGKRLEAYLADPNALHAKRLLEEAGVAFGALAAKPYSLSAALDVEKVSVSTAKDLLNLARGGALIAAKASPVTSLLVDSGSSFLFDVGGVALDRADQADDLLKEQTTDQELRRLQASLKNNLRYLAYFTVLHDDAQVNALRMALGPADLPADLLNDEDLGVRTSADWEGDLFEDGRVVVPQPAKVLQWRSFLAWSSRVNPQLEKRVDELTVPMLDAFDRTIG